MMFGEEDCGRLTLDGHLTPTCACYKEGYRQGNTKAWEELETWRPGTHFPGCGCTPCKFAAKLTCITEQP